MISQEVIPLAQGTDASIERGSGDEVLSVQESMTNNGITSMDQSGMAALDEVNQVTVQSVQDELNFDESLTRAKQTTDLTVLSRRDEIDNKAEILPSDRVLLAIGLSGADESPVVTTLESGEHAVIMNEQMSELETRDESSSMLPLTTMVSGPLAWHKMKMPLLIPTTSSILASSNKKIWLSLNSHSAVNQVVTPSEGDFDAQRVYTMSYGFGILAGFESGAFTWEVGAEYQLGLFKPKRTKLTGSLASAIARLR